jgi:hypothetical protein
MSKKYKTFTYMTEYDDKRKKADKLSPTETRQELNLSNLHHPQPIHFPAIYLSESPAASSTKDRTGRRRMEVPKLVRRGNMAATTK